MTVENKINRSIKIDVFAAPEQRQAIISSIRKYRAAARKMFCAIAMSEIAGATVDEKTGIVKPSNDRSKKILADAFDLQDKKAHAYELRNFIRTEFAPEWMSFVWDSLRADVSSRWRAKDGEFPKATRGYLIDQGARSLGFFAHIGIGFPQATAKPTIEDHKLHLKWTHDLGEIVFTIGKLDPGRYWHFKNVRDKSNGYEPGTFFLNERDGRLFVLISFSAPMKSCEIDPNAETHVHFNIKDKNNFLTMGSIAVDVTETAAWISELKKLSEKFQERMGAAGNPKKPWGHRKAFKSNSVRLNHITERRENGTTVRNHLWSRRIVDEMKRNQTGKLIVHNFPTKEMFGFPWKFDQLKNFISYKCSEIGASVTYVNE